MTPDDNAALIRRGYEAFNTGDLATLTELFREDSFAHQSGSSSLSGDYRGRDEVFGFFGLLAERSGGTFRAELERLFASDRRVVTIHHATASREGATLETHTALVFELADGKVAGFDAIQEDQLAWDAFFG